MAGQTTLKVDQTSRSSIDSLYSSKEEFSALIAKMDNEMASLSQQIRLAGNGSNVEAVERLNKLRLHRRKLQEMRAGMEAIQEESWERIHADAIAIFKKASMAMQ